MRNYLYLLLLFITLPALAQKADMAYYLPDGAQLNPSIPTPAAVLGYEVGEWHVSHDHLVHYMKTLAAASDRIAMEEYGRTYENRPLYLLTITSPSNHQRLEQIREEHVKLTDPSQSARLNIDQMPSVVYMGFSVHGNEPSGSNAALLAAYYFAASTNKEIEEQLSQVVILFDPSFNPDGLNRFASWVNTHKSKHVNADPNSREHNEVWPGGRTNHYWFDLNRDWLVAQQAESRGRIENFHAWKPNVLTDHHEMGTNSTFFFQPGIPTRNHPITPKKNFELTEKIGQFHAKYLDQIGSFYYTKESFDDFYYGKGSTYPDVNGGIGILFEQASSRGHAQESIHGVLTFPFTIRNQFTTTLSTLRAAYEMRKELLEYQRSFFQSAVKDASSDPVKAYVFGSEKDKARTWHLADILHRQKITFYELAKDITEGGKTFKAGASYVVPLDQPNYRMIKGMFEKRTSFEDSLFYDISAWSLLLAFNLEHAELNARAYAPALRGKEVRELPMPTGKVLSRANYAYAFEWYEYYTPKALSKILASGLKAKVATEPFFGDDGKRFENGTVMIPVSGQNMSEEGIFNLLRGIAAETGVEFHALNTGYNPGINLGSPSFSNLTQPRIMLLVDDGVTSNDAGEIWHLLDQRFDMDVTLLSIDAFNRRSIDKYTTLLMVNGNYSAINKDKLRNWIQGGGTVVAMKSAGKWLADNGLSKVTYKATPNDDKAPVKQLPYNLQERYTGAQVIGGAIFNGRLDLSHPLAYGYTMPEISVFRNNTLYIEKPKNAYASPVTYTSKPLASGYISKENLAKLSDTSSIVVGSLGSGRIITMNDNPAFRAFWFGTNKLLMNAIFFGPIINGATTVR
jgi:hypothetical protein